MQRRKIPVEVQTNVLVDVLFALEYMETLLTNMDKLYI